MSRPTYLDALDRVSVLSALAGFDPHVAGTPQLGLDLGTSDIDVLCHAPDPQAFVLATSTAFSGYPDFAIRQWVSGERPVIAAFTAEGWMFELFGHPQPVREQVGWRHYRVEQRLLSLGGERLRAIVIDHRLRGLETEPAFADALNLAGDPYQALLDIETWPDDALSALLIQAGIGSDSTAF